MKTELTVDLAQSLVKACPRFLHHNQVALSCGITPSFLFECLRRGLTTLDEPFVSFAEEYYAADMRYCRESRDKLFDEETEPTMLRHLWDWHRTRWPATETEASILPLSESKETKKRALVASLRAPTPELAAALSEAGWVRGPSP